MNYFSREVWWYNRSMEPITTTGEAPRKITPKFFFLSLGVLVSLITSVTAFLNLAFAILDFKYPDVLNATYQYGYNSFNYNGARSYIAILVIFLPIFLVLVRYWKKTVHGSLGVIDEAIRKWMLYLIIFLSVLVAAVDLVTLVQYFVGGEITTRFIIKVIVTLFVAFCTGIYYLNEIKTTKWKKSIDILVPWAVVLVPLALVIWSFSIIGTPGQQRLWRLDDKRVSDLQNIQGQVINYWQQKQKLPATLEELANPTTYFSIPVDPEFQNGKTYTYKATGDLSFELCATFSAKMPQGWNEYKNSGVMPMYEMGSGVATDVAYPYPGYGSNQSWDHDAGEKCFTRTIDKDLYPPYPKPL